MGTLAVPTSGSVYLDANGFIYSVERIEPYRSLLEPIWLAAQAGQIKIASSELTLLETLVKPIREGNALLEGLFRSLLHAGEVELIPATSLLWERAAQIRAATNLKTPDALHAATALASGCVLFLTNDQNFRRVSGLPVAILSEVVAAP